MEEQNKVNIEVVSIDDLIQDDHNFNKGNEQGAQLLERSFRECGAGRSVLIDKDNRLVGGNKAQKGFKAAGKIRAPFTQGGGLRRGCGKMVGHLGKILAKKSVQVWPMVN